MAIRSVLWLVLCCVGTACTPATQIYCSDVAKVEVVIPASWTQEPGYIDRWSSGGEFVQFEALGGLADLAQVSASERDNTYRPLSGPNPPPIVRISP